jgi:hypothetical protein
MRRMPAPRPLTRPAPTLTPKVELYIVCEGENTEPEYFAACVREYGAGLVRLKIVPGAGAPFTLVTEAVNIRNQLVKRCRKSPDSFDSCFRVWAVFDRDEHPRIDEAFVMARDNRVDVAFSDPCFEIWPLLHIEEFGSQAGRHDVQRRLSEVMEGYDHNDGAIINFAMIKDSFEIAFRRADNLLKARVAEGCPNGRPSTTVGHLVLKIIQNGKCG